MGTRDWRALERNYRCGTCGSRLVTRVIDGEWVTLCPKVAAHREFVRAGTVDCLRAREVMKELEAQDVLAHLPEELRREIEGGRSANKRIDKPSSVSQGGHSPQGCGEEG